MTRRLLFPMFIACALAACVSKRAVAPSTDDSESAITAIGDAGAPDGGWRSELFPADWRPVHAGGRPTADGRFLHDFAFAGYHRGDVAPPVGDGTIVRTLDATAFGDGRLDATSAIQVAIDEACALGGGVVKLSPGIFRIAFPAAAGAPALRVPCSHLVLRGAGSDAAGTRLFLDARVARQRAMIDVAPGSFNFRSGDGTRPERLLTEDAILPTRTLHVDTVSGFAIGDHVAVRTDLTDAFRAEHHMDDASTGAGDFWPSATPASTGLTYLRRVTALDARARTITLDAPTRYELELRDNARVFRTAGYIEEVGLESFAIGMREHATSAPGTLPGPLGDAADADFAAPGTAAYDVHASSAIRVAGAHDGWIVDVKSYAPATNSAGAHILSIGVWLEESSQRVTVRGCELERPQYRGGGGNGYAFLVQGMDHMIVDSHAVLARHDFIVGSMSASGNVFLRDHAERARYSDDSHRYLSQANLYDSLRLESAWLQSVNRGTDSTGAGFTATQTVYWNTQVLANHPLTVSASEGFPRGAAIETAQWGWGYAIGTQATQDASAEVYVRAYTNSAYAPLEPGLPRDFVEGVGKGATLVPPSLYEEQLRLRIDRGE